jgi:hypothetical protein
VTAQPLCGLLAGKRVKAAGLAAAGGSPGRPWGPGAAAATPGLGPPPLLATLRLSSGPLPTRSRSAPCPATAAAAGSSWLGPAGPGGAGRATATAMCKVLGLAAVASPCLRLQPPARPVAALTVSWSGARGRACNWATAAAAVGTRGPPDRLPGRRQ